MTAYATLKEIKASINTEKTTEDEVLVFYADQASRRIDRLMHSEVPFFSPYRENRPIEVTGMNVNSRSNSLQLGGYLLELDGVTLDGSALAVDASVFAYPAGASPITGLRLSQFCQSWYDWCASGCTTEPPTIEVDGIWGYRRRGGKRWVKVGVLTAAIDADDTTLTITTGGGALGAETFALSAGHSLRIGDEFLGKVYSASGIVVERGVDGSTAAPHDANADVYVWQVEENIKRVVARQAGLMLARRGAYDIRGSNDVGTPIVYPGDLLQELYGVLDGYAYL